MKNKMLIIVLVLSSLGLIIGFKAIFSYKRVGVQKLETYPLEQLPDFTLSIGSPNKEQPILITKNDVMKKDIAAYKFKGKIDNNWKIVENDYVGIRVLDILKAYNLNYEDTEFYEIDHYSVKYKKDEINEDMFIVFFKDDKAVGDIEPISMISFKHEWNKSLANINYIYIYEEPNNQ